MRKTPPWGESGPDARRQALSSPSPSAAPGSFITHRSPIDGNRPQRGSQDKSLTLAAHGWLAKLPPRYQPMVTARRHPHIVNQLSALWDVPARLSSYVHELLLATRRNREGFSLGVLTELTDLQTLIESMGRNSAQAEADAAEQPENVRQQFSDPVPRKTMSACERISDQRR